MTEAPRAAPYEPREDTFLLIGGLPNRRVARALEIGVGSGAVTERLAHLATLAVGTDVQRAALRTTAARLQGRAELVHGTGATPFREGVFDLVAFNPPYLPPAPSDDRTVDGGAEGIQVTVQALPDIGRVLRAEGLLLVVASSQGNVERLLATLGHHGFTVRRMQSKKLFFEELFLFEAVKA